MFSPNLAIFWSVKACSYFDNDSLRSVNQDVTFSDSAIVDDSSAPNKNFSGLVSSTEFSEYPKSYSPSKM